MNETLILLATFVGVLLFSTVIVGRIASQREMASRLTDAASDSDAVGGSYYSTASEITDDRYGVFVKNYFNVVRKDANSNSLPNRLLRAGFFSPQASTIFQTARAVISVLVLLGTFLVFEHYLVSVSRPLAILISMLCGGLVFFIHGIVLERMGVAKEKAYRRIFPDFMDMLIVCVDAGLSVEAAADRVAREFMSTRPDFGLHLSIMMLEVRGGRRLRDALTNLATRLRIDEARSLAVLFRQSEELGSSVTKSLRVYSKEMRQMRILRAEEKANALPIKMLFPLATCLFPLSLIIVLMPIIMRVASMLKSMTPG
ncbi:MULTISPECIES: type II secretion system F family protein [unclassified Mesorhizobium]|uniref:type II secretion system F family protein n=1 Tax=unclassified Mesorhizobium TaxID=325217 RepID=UPI0003CEDE17|nr:MULTISPECIES: type II secretion system F family protein [unclassified Mesorhizobium]ESY51669.1 type II secretion protein F [Mesorhizobium sp. LNJC374B00]ESY58555.1 type II secretion protein F [Mesorhizobium sp. LNJC372A00]ESZ54660.1 TadC pilus assembly protein [Mesorhizobium sp. L103C120A0]ESZ64004.1 type II secretion protein F [Mesorhizobium sp. L103C131B0]WJI42674.1 type II secretion system F family protein [Mesorhizobium sp. C120A]